MATPLRGRVPNTRWPGATLTWEELRNSNPSSINFVPLPPLQRPAAAAAAVQQHRAQASSSSSSPPPPPPQQQQQIDPSRVRQDDSPLTRLLHRGVLTGGYINALLGLADGGAGAAGFAGIAQALG